MRTLNLMLVGFCLGIAVAWGLEAAMVGRGPISQYLAPVAICGIFVSSGLSVAASARRKARAEQP